MTKYERIVSLLKDMNTADCVAIHNEYCDLTKYGEDHVYCMEDLDEVLGNCTPTDLACKIEYGSFWINDRYFFFDGYANLSSFSQCSCYGTSTPIDIDAIAGFAVENNEDYGNTDICDILESEENDNED